MTRLTVPGLSVPGQLATAQAIVGEPLHFAERFVQSPGALRDPWDLGATTTNFVVVSSGIATSNNHAPGANSYLKTAYVNNYVQTRYLTNNNVAGSIYTHCSAQRGSGAPGLFLVAAMSGTNTVSNLRLISAHPGQTTIRTFLAGSRALPMTWGLGWDGVSTTVYVYIDGGIFNGTVSIAGNVPSFAGITKYAAIPMHVDQPAVVTVDSVISTVCGGYANLPLAIL